MKRAFILCLLFAMLSIKGYSQLIKGVVISSTDGSPIVGVSVALPSSGIKTLSDKNGNFSIKASKLDSIITFSSIGYQATQQLIKDNSQLLKVSLVESINLLDEVAIATGYQKIASSSATGSFEQIGTKLLERSVGTDILSRIENLSTGTYFDRRNYSINKNPLSLNNGLIIRGLSTLNANAAPLIVLDNFPYDGDINNINPNDIESITLLKDAAAAAIWGARAGNGVVVITTKNASYNAKLKVTMHANLNIFDKPNLFATNMISPSEKIDAEIFLFEKGYYKVKETAVAKAVLPPVVELLIKQRDQVLNQQVATQMINELRQIDNRNEYLKYFYRQAVNQQYALNVTGGAEKHNFLVSIGHDINLPTLMNTRYERSSIRLSNTIRPIKNLEIQTRFSYLQANELQPSSYRQLGYGNQNLYSYVNFKDSNGEAIVMPFDYRVDYVKTAKDKGLLDWGFRPVEEINLINNRSNTQDFVGNIGANYKIAKHLGAELKYQYQKQLTAQKDLLAVQSYYARNLINRFTQQNNGQISYGVPLGGILDQTDRVTKSQSLRGQLNFNQNFNEKHEISAIGGVEVRDVLFDSRTNRTFGYDDNMLGFSHVNAVDRLPIYDNLGSASVIPNNWDYRSTNDRYVSFYANGSYALKQRYILSLSARKDASNLFGLATNEKWTPLWSAGLAWNVAKEDFFDNKVLQQLKLRATYGYSGNIDNSSSALTTLYYYAGSSNAATQLPYAGINNPPNPHLRWEKVRTVNLGVDFSFVKRILYGSIDIYQKNTFDLFAPAPLDITTGLSRTVMNSANTTGKGFDISLHSDLFNTTNFKWTSSLQMSYNKTIVTKYLVKNRPLINISLGINPIEGAVLYPVYAYAWAGLDPLTGDPLGYYNSGVSKAYSDIVNKTPVEQMKLLGSALPLHFGGFRNDLSYKKLALSFNIVYKLNYYFRRQGITYASIGEFGGTNEFSQRWQKSGDEVNTNVPSFVYPVVANRDNFYNGAEINVEKGDHIRLQDIRLSYTVKLKQHKTNQIKDTQVFALVNNLGILWRANKRGIDPQSPNGVPIPKNFAFGIIANL